MKYLKHNAFDNWVIKILPYQCITVWGLDITVSSATNFFLENKDFIEATEDEFDNAFEKTILELKTLAQ